MTQVTPDLERQVVQWRAEGQTYRDIMAATGLNSEALHTLLARNGLASEYVKRGPDESRLTRWACPLCGFRSDRASGHPTCRGVHRE